MGAELPEGFTLDPPSNPSGELPEGFEVDAPSVGEELMQLPYGFNASVANALDMPETLGSALGFDDVTAWVNRQLGLPGSKTPEEVRSKREEFKRGRAVDVTGFLRDSPQPTTPLGRGMRYGGEMLAESIPYAAAPYLAAGRVPMGAANQAHRTVSAPNALRGSGRAIETGVANAPVKAGIGEAAATAGAGTGGAVAKEVYPDSQGAEMVGQLIGGLMPQGLALAPSALVLRGTMMLRQRLSKKAMEEAAERRVSEDIGEFGATEQKNLDRAVGLEGEIPGFKPSLAQATNNPNLIRQQQGLENTAVRDELAGMSARYRGNEAAVELYRRNAMDVADGATAPEVVVDAARGKADVLTTRAGRAADDVTARREDLASRVPRADRADAGVTIRDELLAARSAKKDEMKKLANDLGLNDLDITTEFDDAAKRIAATVEPNSPLARRSELDVYKFLKGLKGGKQEGVAFDAAGGLASVEVDAPLKVTFKDLMEFRSELSEDLLDATRAANPRARDIRKLKVMQKEFDTLVDEIVESADPSMAGKYKQFRDTYYKEYINPYEGGVAFKLRRQDRGGRYVVSDEKVAGAFFKAGDVTAARQFKQTVGTSPEAVAALEASALDSFADYAIRDGVIDPKRAETWLRNHESVLKEFGIEGSFGGAQVSQKLADRQVTLLARQRQVENSVLVKQLESIESGASNPADFIAKAVTNPRLMKQAVNAVKGTEGEDALRRAVWDVVSSSDPKALAKHLKDNRNTLEIVFSPQHLDNLEIIQEARQILARLNPPKGGSKLPAATDQLEKFLGQQTTAIGARAFAFQSGRIGGRWVALDGLMRFIRGRDIAHTEDLYKQALYDPQVGRDLAEMLSSRKYKPDVANRLNTRLFLLGHITQDEDE